jgi:type III restriction enzyme
VKAYVKNHALGFEVPYRTGSVAKRYRPDFIVVVDDGRPDPLHLVVEIKGFHREEVKDNRNAMLGSWIPGANRLGTHGRWAFAEFRDVWEIESGLAAAIAAAFGDLVAAAAGDPQIPS